MALWAGSAAEAVLSRGVGFDGLTIAVTAPAGDRTADALALWLGRLRDVKTYAGFTAMEPEAAEAALRQGEVDAVLALPSGFIDGVLDGTDPAVTLTVSPDRPLQGLLAAWVGRAAGDLLTAFQQGIYAALDTCEQAGLDREAAVLGVNLRYIDWALGREKCFRMETVSATGALSPARHYGLSLAACFLLALAPTLSAVYGPAVLAARRRLRAVGRGSAICLASDVIACALVFFPAGLVLLLAQAVPAERAALSALIGGILAALWGAVLCLGLRSGALRGLAAFLTDLLWLVMAGGLVPSVLLPPAVQRLAPLSPITALRSLAAGQGGGAALTTWAAALALAAVFLYDRASQRKEETA